MGTRKKTSCAVLLIAALSCAPALAQNPVTSSGGPQEGIKVHGDWVIEVRNPDGGLAERREFKNSLLSQGSNVLALLLGRQASTGHWVVGLSNSVVGAPDPCDGFAGAPASCGIYEVLIAGGGGVLVGYAPASSNLQLTLFPGQIRLAGSVTATAAATLNEVSTFIGTCSSGTAPATPCQPVEGPTHPFSRTSPNAFAPVNVVAGQIIQVTVSFTFS